MNAIARFPAVAGLRFKTHQRSHHPLAGWYACRFWLSGLVAISWGCSCAEQPLQEQPASQMVAEEPQGIDEAEMPASTHSVDAASSIEQKVKLRLNVEEANLPSSFMRIGNPLKSYFAEIELYNGGDETIHVYTDYGGGAAWIRVRNELGALVSRTSNAKMEMRPDPESGGVDGIWNVVSGHFLRIEPGESMTWPRNISACFHIETGNHSAQAFINIGWMEGVDRSRGATIESNVVEFSVSELK